MKRSTRTFATLQKALKYWFAYPSDSRENDSQENVDDMVRKAVVAGGSTGKEPKDHGFM